MDIRSFCFGLAVCCSAVSAKGNDIDTLLGRMTLEEKVGQLVQLGSAGYASDDQSKVAISDELRTAIREGRVGSLIGACGVKKFNELQRIAKEESRLGIPLMVGHDVIHGCRTVLPIPIGLSCSWDEGLWRRGAEMMAVEALSRGCNWTFNPMVDISRDARWGRIAESPGQDPLLAARYAAAMVKGYQGEDPSDGRHIAACLKHYLAYGACEGGRDYNTVELSNDTLRNVYLPPFAAGVAAGAMTVMPAFHAINGEPCSANRYLLTDILRGELGFTGFTISDYNAVGELASGHAVAESPTAAAVLSMNAGMDMDMMSGSYRDGLIQAVRDGRVPMKTLDMAVRRILSVKARLGLFERPYVDADIMGKIDIKAHHALAREAAAKSIVLVKNERQVLPLKAGQKIVLLGALSGDRDEMLGCWQTWKDGFENATVREGLVADGAVVEYVGAYTPTGAVDRAAIRAVVEKADVVVASFGESCWDYGSMNGENCSRADIGLPGHQLEAVEEIKASGKPFVALLFCGRPLAVPELMSAADAVVVAWNPGSSGGWGVADVLTGRSEPYGRLTVDFPHKTGECPLYYNRLPTGRPWKADKYWVTKYIDAPSPGRSLLCFGQGLTYTTFTYADENVIVDGSNVVFSATVANAGARTGSEVVQVYVRDLVASVSRPRRELKGFVRVTLKPGESRTVRVAVPRCEFGFWHQGKYAVEQGEFAAWIAPGSDSGRELRFRLPAARRSARCLFMTDDWIRALRPPISLISSLTSKL